MPYPVDIHAAHPLSRLRPAEPADAPFYDALSEQFIRRSIAADVIVIDLGAHSSMQLGQLAAGVLLGIRLGTFDSQMRQRGSPGACPTQACFIGSTALDQPRPPAKAGERRVVRLPAV